MPHLSSLTVWLWFLGTAANLFLFGLVYVTKHFRRWPSLFTYLGLINCQSIYCALAEFFGRPLHYFWGYWILQIAVDIAEVWIIVQIAQLIAGVTPRLRRLIAKTVPLCAAAAFCVAIRFSFSDPSTPGYERVVYAAEHLDLAINVALCITCIAVVWEKKGMGVQWRDGVRGIACGLLLEVLTCHVASFLNLRFPVASINALQGFSYLATLGIWCAAVIGWHRSMRTRQPLISG